MDDRAIIDRELSHYLDRVLSRSPQNLAKSIRYSVLSDGKRIRPRITLETARIFDLPFQDVLPIALALELGHAFTLIHDDLPCMDNDTVRRGKPTNHVVFGEGMALLAGDATFSLAFEALLPLGPRVIEPLRIFTQCMGPSGVMGGQAQEAEVSAQPSLDSLRVMHRLKTGVLFEASVLMPLALATYEPNRISPSQQECLSGFAKNLGAAFQIADDLDDHESSPTSILHYLSVDETRRELHALLQSARDMITSAFGSRGANLIAILNTLQRP
jgi:geranylgeranyl diphosphate synthase type II